MTSPYGLMADLHLHPWSAFSSVTTDGMNNRLAGLLAEIERGAREVHAAGGRLVIFAGDVFHVRGSVSPTVLNSARDLLDKLGEELGVMFFVMPGNHDLEGKETTRLSSAVTALSGKHVVVSSGEAKWGDAVMVPWIENIDDLKKALEETGAKYDDRANLDLIIHAPIDGVIPGLPAHGLHADFLASLGFRRVFAGHYHNHKCCYHGSTGELTYTTDVYSIGALAHHTWSDIGTKAGFLIVYPDRVDWRKSHLPEFIDLSQLADIEPEEVPLLVDGNFVRVRVEASKVKEVDKARDELLAMGARGVIVQAQPKPTERTSTGAGPATVASGASLEVSVVDFIKGSADPAISADVQKAALDILSTIDAKE